MKVQDEVTAIFDDLCRTYDEATQTYGRTSALVAVLHLASLAVYELEHEVGTTAAVGSPAPQGTSVGRSVPSAGVTSSDVMFLSRCR